MRLLKYVTHWLMEYRPKSNFISIKGRGKRIELIMEFKGVTEQLTFCEHGNGDISSMSQEVEKSDN